MAAQRILIVDDEKLIRWTLQECLQSQGYQAVAVENGTQAWKALEEGGFDAVLLDYKLPDTEGFELLERVHSAYPGLPVIMVTAHSSVEHAVAAIQRGAADYITKPFTTEEILHRVATVLENHRLKRVVASHQEEKSRQYSFEKIIGGSTEMQQVLQLVKRVLDAGDTTILIQGESGTGKDVLAKAIHYNSSRAAGPYVNITCTAIPETLLESILFGHEKGAFTDARAQKKGLLEEAGGGTVFLDEIGDMTPYLQGKLLRFLEEKTFRRVGGNQDIKVDVRVIAATNRDLKKLVHNNQFREDLYFRLNVIPIHVPPLRERKGDIPLLVEAFIEGYNREFRRSVKGVSPAILKRFEEHSWPGNVRELKNTIERAMILGREDVIDVDDLPIDIIDEADVQSRGGEQVLKLTRKGLNLEKLEEDLVRQALKLARGNQTKAGKYLGLNRDQIRYRIEKFSIDLTADQGLD
jgi:DNA-binding NtrC family response regulator